jgi:hypothetical protein
LRRPAIDRHPPPEFLPVAKFIPPSYMQARDESRARRATDEAWMERTWMERTWMERTWMERTWAKRIWAKRSWVNFTRRGGVGIAAALVLLLGLGACGQPQRSTWTKDGADLDQTKDDQRACLREASGYAFLSQNPADQSGVGANAASSQQADLYRTCMQRRGYSQGPAPARPGQDNPSSAQ